MFKQITSTAAPLALAMILSGCMSLAPKYERPAAPVAASFPLAGSASNQAAATIAWESFFADARLKQLIGQALTNNRDLRVAILNIEQARAQFQIRRADSLPTVAVAARGSSSSPTRA